MVKHSDKIKEDRIGYIMHELKIIGQLHKAMMKKVNSNLTYDQTKLLFLIDEEKMSQKEIAKKLNITEATLSVRIKRLIDQGLVEKKVDQKDKRKYKIVLSKKGNQSIEQVIQMIQKSHAVMKKGVTEEEFQLIVKVIGKIKNNLEEEIK